MRREEGGILRWPCRGWGRRWSWYVQKSAWRILLGSWILGFRPPQALQLDTFGAARETGCLLTCRICPPASHITKDMLPGPYPKTPEERAAAAKKYNMRVEDYEPYPDDGMG